MPETTTPAGAMPVVAGATPAQSTQADPPAATGTAGTPPATGTPTTTDDGQLGDGGRKALDAERAARRDAEQRAKTAQDELEKLRTASLSEDEKRQRRLVELERAEADWQRERQEFVLERVVERSAAKLGFADPVDALGLLDRTALEFEADGHPRNVEQLLQTLAKAKPYLMTQARPSASFDTGTAGGRAAGGTIYSLDQLRDTKFYEANRDDILQARKEGRIR